MAWGRLWWYVFLLAFGATALAETFLPFRPLPSSTPRRWLNNSILLALSNAAVICAYRFSGIALTVAIRASSHGFLNRAAMPYSVQFTIGFVALDLTAYFSHRLFHAVAPMWRMHQVHHSETDLDLTTGFRFHPMETLLSEGLALAVVALLGPPVAAIAFAGLAVIVLDFFEHGNFRLPESADRILRLLIITPGMHRIHHSEVLAEQNTNFGTIFSLWDRLFGTYLAAHASPQPRCGLVEVANGSDLNAARLLLLPFRRASKEPFQTVPAARTSSQTNEM